MIGLVIILPICVVTAYYRGMLAYKSSGEKAVNDDLFKSVKILLWTINAIEVVTSVLMIDALRRI